jgi:hypothetical protein
MPNPWTDNTIMPWGKHKGMKLKDVPASYLLWCYGQPWMKDGWPQLYAYLKAHEDQLMAEKVDNDNDHEDDDGFRSYDDYRKHRGF